MTQTTEAPDALAIAADRLFRATEVWRMTLYMNAGPAAVLASAQASMRLEAAQADLMRVIKNAE